MRRRGASGSDKDGVIKEVIESGSSVEVRFMHCGLSEDEALDLEAMEIENLGIANLTNVMRRGCKSSHDMAGVGIGRALASAYMELPRASLRVRSVEMSSITPEFLHECLDDVLRSSLSGSASKRVVDGISRAISDKYSGEYSRM